VRNSLSSTTLHGLNEGDMVELVVKEKGRGGAGIARLHGCIIFVHGAVVGEKVKARITKISARHGHADAVQHLGQEGQVKGEPEKHAA
jgi:predicted RNA-binding protein with TRAM domain